MNNTRTVFVITACCVLLTVLTIGPNSQAAQLYINELLKNDQFVHTMEEPIMREKTPRPQSAPPTEGELPANKVALTFDDGPDAKNTAKILDILAEEKVSATFFVVGERVPRFPSVIERIFNEGHLLANHSQTHTDLAELTNEEIIELELDPTSRAVENITGFYPTVMRPPYGSLRVDSIHFLLESGWKIVRWSLDTFDWDKSRNSPEEIVQRVLELHHPNAVILMHCNGQETVAALPDLIDGLRELGYDFVTVTQF